MATIITESLFPADLDLETDEELYSENEEIIGYKPAPLFDYKTGDFLLNGSGQVITADKVTAYTQWCKNVIATCRNNHDAYDSSIGIDWDAVFSAQTRDEAESIIESEISEALACDPYGRTEYVQSVDCEWHNSEEVTLTIKVIALDNELVTIDTVIYK